MNEFTIKTGDTRPSIEAQLLDEQNQPRDLTSINYVRFHMERVDDGETIIDTDATVLDADDGTVVYEWSAGDTDVAGRYDAEFEVEYAGGDVETFPNNGYIDIYIEEELA